MAHPQQREFCLSVRNRFPEHFTGKWALDIGSLDINGNNQYLFDKSGYIGVDLLPGRNVDFACKGHELQFPDNSFDVIVSTECFEHDPYYEKTIKNIVRMLRPGGLFLFTCATTGRPEHGTRRTRPEDAPLIQEFGDWGDYYKNLDEQDIIVIPDFISSFSNHQFSTNDIAHDLYFWGIKKGEMEHYQGYSFLQPDYSPNRKLNEALEKSVSLSDQLAASTTRLKKLESDLSETTRELNRVSERLLLIEHSKSWRLMAPLRVIARIVRGDRPLISGGMRHELRKKAKAIYWKIPARFRPLVLKVGYRVLPWLFIGSPNFEHWKNRHKLTRRTNHSSSALIDINELPIATIGTPSIAIHLHVFYSDLAAEFAKALRNMPFDYDLYVSVVDIEAMTECETAFRALPRLSSLTLEIVQNRGRDIAPMFCNFGERLRNYEYIAHLHSKKSLYNRGATDGWREYLISALLGSPTVIKRIIGALEKGSGFGIVYPQNFHLLPSFANTWLANRMMGEMWAARFGISRLPNGYFDFPAASMFWARSDALTPMFDARIRTEEFAEELGQKDGTLAHCIERFFAITSQSQGYTTCILRDQNNPAWSPWRLDQILHQSVSHLEERLTDPEVNLIGFDIFDTLLVRPLIDPDTTKEIVRRRVGGEIAELYIRNRGRAESMARQELGRDVNLSIIFDYLQQISGLSEDSISLLKQNEEEVERLSVTSRPGGALLYRKAISTGKKVVLLSDMFLSKMQIEECLRSNHIDGWSDIFVSNDSGYRKDTGELYDFVFSKYGISPHQFLMIGDNERSDVQIPLDKGSKYIHVLRATEIGRGCPRMNTLLCDVERNGSVDDQLTLGLVLRENFSETAYPGRDHSDLFNPTPYNIGYSILGPLLTSFSNWLLKSSQSEQVSRLYFLAREGELLKSVFDRWANGILDSPESHYLVVSRRSTSVPSISSFEDILTIAQTTYFPNKVSSFIEERYGLTLTSVRWAELKELTSWNPEKLVEVRNKQIDHLIPLLKQLESEILTTSISEKYSITQYLTDMGLFADGRQAVVDVGYGGTIQGYLNRLIEKPVHGFYLMTDDRINQTTAQYGVTASACFYSSIAPVESAPTLYQYSFELEKFMSSNDPQVIRYDSANGSTSGVFKQLTSSDIAGRPFRDELRAGIYKYVDDAIGIRDKLLAGFCPSPVLSAKIYELFFTLQSPAEQALLKRISLDDHYCGRGIVS